MKLLVFIFIFCGLLLTTNLFSQDRYEIPKQHSGGIIQLRVLPKRIDRFSAIDTAIIEIKYELLIIADTNKPNEIQKDISVLQIGNHISKSYSESYYKDDSIMTAAIKSGLDYRPLAKGLTPPIEVYKNYPQNMITVTYRTFMKGPTYLYVEEKTNFQWKILPEKRNYLSYNCQKAVTLYRGREYEAWFTTEIPISEGPYKFSGLPGLILQIKDKKNQYIYNCISIQNGNQFNFIKMWAWKYINTTREKLNALLVRIHQNPIEFMNSNGFIVTQTGTNGQQEPINKNYFFPFNPIELE